LFSIMVYLPPQIYHRLSLWQHYFDQLDSAKTPSKIIGYINLAIGSLIKKLFKAKFTYQYIFSYAMSRNLVCLYSRSSSPKDWPLMSQSDWVNLQAGSYTQHEVGPKRHKKES
jgi:hypothetical protein